VREIYSQFCPEITNDGIDDCPVKLEYDLTGLTPEEVYDARCKEIQRKIDLKKARRHIIPNSDGDDLFKRGWRL